MVCIRLVLFSPLFCAQAWQCLRLGLALHMEAILQSGLLAQVSSLRLPYSKQCSPRLPAQPPLASGRCRCVTVGHVICGF